MFQVILTNISTILLSMSLICCGLNRNLVKVQMLWFLVSVQRQVSEWLTLLITTGHTDWTSRAETAHGLKIAVTGSQMNPVGQHGMYFSCWSRFISSHFYIHIEKKTGFLKVVKSQVSAHHYLTRCHKSQHMLQERDKNIDSALPNSAAENLGRMLSKIKTCCNSAQLFNLLSLVCLCTSLAHLKCIYLSSLLTAHK